MALISIFLGCFSDSSKVACGEYQAENSTENRSSRKAQVQAKTETETRSKLKNNKSKKSPPVPVTYFPIGSRLSLL
ncbi:hypothetical protein ACOSQ2_013224 [Xanthoceras sorbifolium]